MLGTGIWRKWGEVGKSVQIHFKKEEILRVLEQGGRNVILDQTEFINMDVSTGDSEFSVLAEAARNDSNSF